MKKKTLLLIPISALLLTGCGIVNTADTSASISSVWPGEVDPVSGEPTTDAIVNWIGVAIPHYTVGNSYKYQKLLGDIDSKRENRIFVMNVYGVPATCLNDYYTLLDASSATWYVDFTDANHLYATNSNTVDYGLPIVSIEVTYTSSVATPYMSFLIQKTHPYVTQVFPGSVDPFSNVQTEDVVKKYLGVSVPYYDNGALYLTQKAISATTEKKVVLMSVDGLLLFNGWSTVSIVNYINFMVAQSWNHTVVTEGTKNIDRFTKVDTASGKTVFVDAYAASSVLSHFTLTIYVG